LDGQTYPRAIELLANETFLTNERSWQEFLVATDEGMAKLMLD
jgi:hypothetical protein